MPAHVGLTAPLCYYHWQEGVQGLLSSLLDLLLRIMLNKVGADGYQASVYSGSDVLLNKTSVLLGGQSPEKGVVQGVHCGLFLSCGRRVVINVTKPLTFNLPGQRQVQFHVRGGGVPEGGFAVAYQRFKRGCFKLRHEIILPLQHQRQVVIEEAGQAGYYVRGNGGQGHRQPVERFQVTIAPGKSPSQLLPNLPEQVLLVRVGRNSRNRAPCLRLQGAFKPVKRGVSGFSKTFFRLN